MERKKSAFREVFILSGKTKPNILFINTDQQRADSLGCYGNEFVKTPNIDGIARDGVVFDNAHCTHPLCSPSRATMLTGRYIHAHGLWRNGLALKENEVTISSVLKENGYKTGLIGKAHLTPYHGDPKIHPEAVQLNNGVSEEECWEYWRNFNREYYGFEHVQLALGHGDYGMYGGHYGLWIHRNHRDKVPLFSQDAALEPTDKRFVSWKSAVPLEIHSATWIADKTIEFIKENRDRPFFASIGFQEPHPPFNPPKPYCYMYDPADMPLPVRSDDEWKEKMPRHVSFYLQRDGWSEITEDKEREITAHYYGLVTLVDDAVGRILNAVKEEGLEDNTIIVFTSDHGEWLGDHRLRLKGAVHTRGLTRVPMIIKWPGVAKAGLHVSAVASQVDLVSTLYDAAGVKEPYGVQGKSLRRVLEGSQRAVRDYALIEHRHESYREDCFFSDRVGKGLRGTEREEKLKRELVNWEEKDIYIKTIVTDRYRLTYIPSLNYGELYDLQNDPNELVNLWDTEADLRVSLQLKLLDALIESTDPLPERKWSV